MLSIRAAACFAHRLLTPTTWDSVHSARPNGYLQGHPHSPGRAQQVVSVSQRTPDMLRWRLRLLSSFSWTELTGNESPTDSRASLSFEGEASVRIRSLPDAAERSEPRHGPISIRLDRKHCKHCAHRNFGTPYIGRCHASDRESVCRGRTHRVSRSSQALAERQEGGTIGL